MSKLLTHVKIASHCLLQYACFLLMIMWFRIAPHLSRVTIRFLPPYSLDRIPVELVFSKVKAKSRSVSSVLVQYLQGIYMITESDCQLCCGYMYMYMLLNTPQRNFLCVFMVTLLSFVYQIVLQSFVHQIMSFIISEVSEHHFHCTTIEVAFSGYVLIAAFFSGSYSSIERNSDIIYPFWACSLGTATFSG